jgi:hypothetical protein
MDRLCALLVSLVAGLLALLLLSMCVSLFREFVNVI